MPTIIVVLSVAVVLTAALAVGFAYHRFRGTPPYRWRERVWTRIAELMREAEELQRSTTGNAADRWRTELFHQHLQTIPLTALLPFSGIGPGTVDRLSTAGLGSVADLTRFDVGRIHGFGPAKSADVRAAVRQVVREAEGRFEAGACPEGQEFRRRVAAQALAEQVEVEGKRLQIQAVNAVLARLSAIEPLANRVTFRNHLLGRAQVELTEELLNRSLPAFQVCRIDSPSRPADWGDDLIDVMPDDEDLGPTVPPTPPLEPFPIDVVIGCFGCGAKLRARSSKPRSRFRVGCPQCGSQVVVELPSTSRQPVFVTPVPPPIPPVAPAPPEGRPVATSVSARPALPPPVEASTTRPADLFQAALAAPARSANSSVDHPNLHRLRVLTRFGFVVAKADGRVAKAERAAIRSFLADLFGHDPMLVRHIDPTIEQVESAVPTEEVVVREVVAVLTDPAARQAVCAAAERIADASGERNRREVALLARVRAALDVATEPTRTGGMGGPPPDSQRSGDTDADAPHVIGPPTGAAAEPDPRTVLEIEPGVELTAELIRRRYTLLTDRADPAKAAVIGPEFEQLAVRKRATIRLAAETLIARFGLPLDPPAAPPPPPDLRHNPDLDDIFGG